MPEKQSTMLELIIGNLLEAHAEALVNTVNTEGVMGSGIALRFAKKSAEMAETYRVACKAGEVRPGQVIVFEQSDMLNPRYVNFPTKRRWRSPSSMEDIQSGLMALAAEIRRRGIRSITVPPLGYGSGGLEWREVRPLIEQALGNLPGVRVLLVPPAGAPEAGRMEHRTERPEMNPRRANRSDCNSQRKREAKP